MAYAFSAAFYMLRFFFAVFASAFLTLNERRRYKMVAKSALAEMANLVIPSAAQIPSAAVVQATAAVVKPCT